MERYEVVKGKWLVVICERMTCIEAMFTLVIIKPLSPLAYHDSIPGAADFLQEVLTNYRTACDGSQDSLHQMKGNLPT